MNLKKFLLRNKSELFYLNNVLFYYFNIVTFFYKNICRIRIAHNL